MAVAFTTPLWHGWRRRAMHCCTSSYIGGSGEDEAYGLAVDRQGQVVACRTHLLAESAAGRMGRSLVEAVNSIFSSPSCRLIRASNFITSSSPSSDLCGEPGTETPAQTIALTSSGQPVTFTVGSDMPFRACQSDDFGTTPATLTLSIDAAAIPAGVTSAVVTINAPAAANGPLTDPDYT